MRKLMVGLVAVALLAVAAPAIAQQADPLGLIASGAVLPYVGSPSSGGIFPGSISFLEVYAPVSANPFLHAFFFDVNCNRTPNSLGLGLTTNDVRVQRIDNLFGNPADGLIAIGGAPNGFHLDPLTDTGGPIHARVLWVNPAVNLGRTLEPIQISHFELELLGFAGPGGVTSTATAFTWNPLRSGHTFFAPLEGGGVSTTIYLVCPDSNIVGAPSATDLTTPVFPASLPKTLATGDFPALLPTAVIHPARTPVDALIYDTDEHPLVNVHFDCSCLTRKILVSDVHPVYGDPTSAPAGTYTEMFGGLNPNFPDKCTLEGEPNQIPCERYSMTGYRAIRVATAPVFDQFGRLHNGNACLIAFSTPHEFTECGFGSGSTSTTTPTDFFR